MSQSIEINKINKTRIDKVDFSTLTFGSVFTDHMLECDFINGEWQKPIIRPYGPLKIDPSASVFHYGQAIFEGMKAYKDNNGKVWLFRPEDNWDRFNKSSIRLAIPEIPKDYFVNGIKELLKLDIDWIKKDEGSALYIRPFVIGNQHAIQAAPSNAYKFMIICSPSAPYYPGGVKVIVADKFSRAASGGVGYAKAAGNYAGQFYPTNLAKEKGFQQIIWTDASEHKYLEEAGTMNLFFRINNTLITTPTSDTILDGITRKSIIQLCKDSNLDIQIRKISVDELKDAAKKNSLKEIFGTGTAAVVSKVIGFDHLGEYFDLPDIENKYADQLKEKLISIQTNKAVDIHNWTVCIDD
jgi:branched-chain amino acid aminotransferase